MKMGYSVPLPKQNKQDYFSTFQMATILLCVYPLLCVPDTHLKERNSFFLLRFQKCLSIRSGKVWWNEQKKAGKSQGDVKPSKKYHQQPFSNQPPPLTFHHLPVMPPNYGSIKALIHSLILVILLATPSQAHSEVCFPNHINSSQSRQPDHQNSVIIVMLSRAVKFVEKSILSLLAT